MKSDDAEKTASVYPYGPISTCLPIAEGVKALGGANSPVSKASLASYLKEDEKAQGLMTKIASAKAFGMIEGRSNFKLTQAAVKYFSSKGSDHHISILEFLESPLAFKTLIQRFDGTMLPNAAAIGTILKDESDVPNSWQERVAGFFVSSAKYAGAIDESGHLRVKASKERRFDPPPLPEDTDPVNSQIQPPRIASDPGHGDLFGIRARGFNALSETLSLSTVDAKTGEKGVIFAEVPKGISFSSWKILEQWVQSMKPAEESK